MLGKITNSILIGIGIGTIVFTACWWGFAGANPVIIEYTRWIIASALYGLLSLLFDYMGSLLKATVIHFLGCASITLITGSLSGYANNFFELAKNMLPIFLVIYVVIYLSCYSYARYNAKLISRKLSHNKD